LAAGGSNLSRFFGYRLAAGAVVALSALAVIAIACGGEDSSSNLKTNGAVSESADGGFGVVGGTTSGTGNLQVRVNEPESLTAGGFAPGKSSQTAFRAWTAIGSGLGTLLIYLVVLSPIWMVIGGVAYLVYRRQADNLKQRSTPPIRTSPDKSDD
jgi:hypothetical protein